MRPCNESDYDFLLDLYGRPDVVRYLPWGLQDSDGIHALIERRKGQDALVETDDKLNLQASARETGERIGEIGLFLRSKEHRGGEVGFVLHPDCHGRGYAKEAANAMLKLGFETFDMHRIIGRCDARNHASAAVLKSLGMRQEALLKENQFEDGEWTDELDFAILKQEWINGTKS
jgi:RimJ/RimL family protein N-acetyltransferase